MVARRVTGDSRGVIVIIAVLFGTVSNTRLLRLPQTESLVARQ
jgi:hypothetical protein